MVELAGIKAEHIDIQLYKNALIIEGVRQLTPRQQRRKENN